MFALHPFKATVSTYGASNIRMYPNCIDYPHDVSPRRVANGDGNLKNPVVHRIPYGKYVLMH